MYSRNRYFGPWNDTPKVLRIFWVSTLVNCVAFFLVSGLVGGYAISGKKEAGRFFVGYQSRYSEVSEITFYGTWAHAAVTVASSIVALLTVLNRGRDVRR